MRVLAGLVQQHDLVDVGLLELAQLLADGVGRTDQAAAQRGCMSFRIGLLPLVVLVPHVDGARRGTLATLRSAVELQRELEELFNSQNKSNADTTSIPATYLRVTVNR